MSLYYDNMNAINILKNHVKHSRTKHINISHHFIRDLVEENEIELEYVPTEKNLADFLRNPWMQINLRY